MIEHIISPIESIWINKWMPKGYKLELSENTTKILTATDAPKIKNINHLPRDSIQQKLITIIKEILRWPQSSNYYTRKVVNEPKWEQIEKKIYHNRYKSALDFAVDLKKLILFYCDNYEDNKNVHDDMTKIGKCAMELIKKIDERSSLVLHRVNSTPMTHEEKICLCDNMRRLAVDKLNGWVVLWTDNPGQYNNAKFFEFDLDKLSHSKCRALENYVRGSLKEYIEYSEMNSANNSWNNKRSNNMSGKGNKYQNSIVEDNVNKYAKNNSSSSNSQTSRSQLSDEAGSGNSSDISK